MYELLYKFRYFFSRFSVCVVWCSISFDLLLSRWYYSTGFSLHTVVAESVNVHIFCNPLITGVIRDVMFTFIAYLFSITTIVSNLHIYNISTTIHVVATTTGIEAAFAVFVTRSFSDGGIFNLDTRKGTIT